MSNKEVVFLLLNIVAANGYAFKCPANSEWRLRAKVSCSSEDKYVCLFHLLEEKYQDDCSKSDLSSIGSNLVFQPLLNIADCNTRRFQPIVFTTYGNSECIMLKSKCDDEGQIIHSPGSPSTDTACRCDYTKGYAFISSPTNMCFCIPSEEDCSCFRVTCAKLSPDYRCIEYGEMIAEPKCTEIHPQISYNEHDEAFQGIENNIKLRFSYAHQVSAIIFVIFFVFIVTEALAFYMVGEKRHHFAGNIVIGKNGVDKNLQQRAIVCTWQKTENGTSSQSTDGKLVEKCNINDIQVRWSQDVGISILESETYSSHGSTIKSENGCAVGVLDQHQLVINFPQPSSDLCLLMCRLEQNCVSLKKVMITENKVLGTIKVQNIEYEKKVFVRVTFNNWSDYSDIECVYFPNESSHTNDIDTFYFEFNVPIELNIDSIIEFAVCFETNTQQYWDNRNEKNYKIKICSKTDVAA